MPEITIRQLSAEEAPEIMYPLTSYAFSPSPPFRDRTDFLEAMALRRGATYVGAFEDGCPVAVAVSSSLTQNIRGRLFGAGGVRDVASHPAARRQGYVRGAMAASLALMRASGQPLSALYPFRESFYERLGYAVMPSTRTARFQTATLAPLLKRDLGGRVDLCSIAEGYDAWRAYLLRMRERTHGMALFTEPNRDELVRRNDTWVALARVGGEVVGVMLYALRNDGAPGLVFKASRFYYDSGQARYLLLQWIARHADQTNQAELRLAPTELPETWLADMRVTVEYVGGHPLTRVADVAALSGLPVGPGSFDVSIHDPLCPWNQGAWHFESVEGALQVSRTERDACELAIQGLAGLVFGVHDPSDFAYRGWGEPCPELAVTMRSMFPAMMPYLHESF